MIYVTTIITNGKHISQQIDNDLYYALLSAMGGGPTESEAASVLCELGVVFSSTWTNGTDSVMRFLGKSFNPDDENIKRQTLNELCRKMVEIAKLKDSRY